MEQIWGLQQTINLGLDAIAFSVKGTFTNRDGEERSFNQMILDLRFVATLLHFYSTTKPDPENVTMR